MCFRYDVMFRIFLVCTFSALFGIASCISGSAQSSLRPATQSLLTKKVHLSLGSTTLPTLLKALSTQTGLIIEAAAYLQERLLVLEIDDISARVILDELAEANDWKWRETTAGHILLSRTLPRYPQNLPEIHKYVVSALPKDIRDFMYLGKTAEELKHVVLPTNSAIPVDSAIHQKLMPESASGGSRQKLLELKYRAAEAFTRLLEPKTEIGKLYPYTQLQPEAQEQLLLYMMFYTLQESSSDLLYNSFTPYQLDMAKAVIEFKGNLMTIGSHNIVGNDNYFYSFGAQVPHLPESPPK